MNIKEFKEKIEEDDEFVYDMLIKLHMIDFIKSELNSSQLSGDEYGFAESERDFLSSVAKNAIDYGKITARQQIWVRKKIKKHAKQILNVNIELSVDEFKFLLLFTKKFKQ